MRRAQKIGLITLAVLVCIGMLFWGSGKAAGRPLEREYFADLAAVGITVENEQGLIAYGKWVCEGLLGFGVPPTALRDLVMKHQTTLTKDEAEDFIVITQKYWCPSYEDQEGPTVLR